jgi:hypothetical protein
MQRDGFSRRWISASVLIATDLTELTEAIVCVRQ